MRAALAAVAALLAIGCSATLGRSTERWPAVVVERWSEMRANDGGPGMEKVTRFVEFHTATKQLVLRVDDAAYQRLVPGLEVTLLVRVNRKGQAMGGDTVILYGHDEPEPKGTDA